MNKPLKKTSKVTQPNRWKRFWGYIGEGLEEMGKHIYDSGFHFPPFI